MSPSELREERKFAELCAISTKTELPERVIESAEEISRRNREEAIIEAQLHKMSYSLYCQTNAHHNCHLQTCGCPCHEAQNESKGESRSALAARINQHADPYWHSRIKGPAGAVGSTNVGSVGWRGGRNDPASFEERGVETIEGSPVPLPKVVHTAGETLASNLIVTTDISLNARVEQAMSMLDACERDGRVEEAARIRRSLTMSGVEPTSNWKAANRARRIEEGRKTVEKALKEGATIVAPSRIQTCPFPSSRKIFIIDETGVTVEAYIPDSEVPQK